MNRPADWVETLPIVTDVGVTPVWSWKAAAGIGGVEELLAALLVELVEEHAVSSPAMSARQMAKPESGVCRIRRSI